MFCPQCGAQAPDESTFCPACGAALTAAPPTAPEPPAVPPPTPPAPAPVAPVAPTAPMPVVAPATPVMQQPGTAVAGGAAYPKAPLGGRFLAALIDGIIGAMLMAPGLLLVNAAGVTGEVSVPGYALLGVGILWQIVFFLGRDGLSGSGPGKRITGSVVTSIATGAPARMGASIVRQLVFYALNLIPGIGSLVEPIMVLVDKDGRRVGDKAAKTQVARAADVAARGHVVKTAKGGAIAFLIVALVVSIAGGAIGGISFARAVSGSDGGSTGFEDLTPTEEPVTEEPAATGEETTEDMTAAGTASESVDLFYAGVAAGDFDAVTAVFSAEMAAGADPGMFEGWTAPTYQILSETPQDDGTMLVEVQEYDGGLSNGIVTFVLLDEGGWKIDYWMLGALDDQSSGGATTAEPDLNAEAAVDAVGTMINALKEDDVELAKSRATANFLATDPGFFRETNGLLTNFEVVENFRDGGTWIVKTVEDWPSGSEPMTYVVVLENGEHKVDGWID